VSTGARGRSGPDCKDASIVAAQLGRQPRGNWTVAARCAVGRPTVIAVAPSLDRDRRFPTTFWLTCPRLSAAVSDLESAGGCASWAGRVAREGTLTAAVMTADAEYRRRRTALAGGSDPCGEVGTAGQADPLAVKCLHARLAATLAGTGDPVGEGVLAELMAAGAVDRCSDESCTPGPGEGVGAAG
jgi:hypothetical protein